MKSKSAILITVTAILLSCTPKNIQYPETLRNSKIHAILYIEPIPEPVAFIKYHSIYPFTRGTILPTGGEENRVQDMMKNSGIKNLVVDELAEQQKELSETVFLNISGKDLEGLDLKISESREKGTLRSGYDYKEIKKKGDAPYIFIITVDRWGYDFDSFAQSCYFYLETTGLLIDMERDTIIWQKPVRENLLTRFAPPTCDLTPESVAAVMKGAVRVQIKTMVRNINGGEINQTPQD